MNILILILPEYCLLFDLIRSSVLPFDVLKFFELSKFTNERAIKVGSAARHGNFQGTPPGLLLPVGFSHDTEAVQKSLTRASLALNKCILTLVYGSRSGMLCV